MDTNIFIPLELLELDLTLDEIGAIIVFHSIFKMSESSRSFWSSSDQLNTVMNVLIDKGVVKMSKDDNDENIMEIDITNIKKL